MYYGVRDEQEKQSERDWAVVESNHVKDPHINMHNVRRLPALRDFVPGSRAPPKENPIYDLTLLNDNQLLISCS